MAFDERVQILSEAEQEQFYGPPAFTSADQRFFFSLNDKELVRLADLCLKALTEELGRRARVQHGQLTGPEKCFPAGVTPRQLSEVNNRGWNLPSFP